jgi:hypothetical protein
VKACASVAKLISVTPGEVGAFVVGPAADQIEFIVSITPARTYPRQVANVGAAIKEHALAVEEQLRDELHV